MKNFKMFKPILCSLLVFILCTTIFIVPTSAEAYDPYDSRYLTPEEEAPLKTNSDDMIIKLYYAGFVFDFSQGKDIASIIEKSNIIYLVKLNDGMILYKRYHNGELVDVSFAERSWDPLFKYVISPELVFDQSVIINSIYCLNGTTTFDGGAIYYDTDHGIYVLFKWCGNPKETYLFPLSDFHEYAKAMIGIDGANIESFETEKYLFNDTPHAVPHPDSDNDGKCDACGGAIPEDNDPFPHITNTNESSVSDTDSDIKEIGCGSCESSLTFPAVTAVGIMGTAIVLKKPKRRFVRKNKR